MLIWITLTCNRIILMLNCEKLGLLWSRFIYDITWKLFSFHFPWQWVTQPEWDNLGASFCVTTWRLPSHDIMFLCKKLPLKTDLGLFLTSHVNVTLNSIHLYCTTEVLTLNTLRPRQNGWHFPDNIFKCIFLNENVCSLIKISLKFFPNDPINNFPELV